MLNKIIANILPYMPKKLIWVFSKRYIAGETIEDGLLASKLLNEKGIEVTIDILGEFIHSIDEAEKNKNEYLEVIERFTNEQVVGNFSLKPTSFGLLLPQKKIRLFVSTWRIRNVSISRSSCLEIYAKNFLKMLGWLYRPICAGQKAIWKHSTI